jgi:uncharacterized protein (UPF0548 family)
MFSLSLDLPKALAEAEKANPDESATWLDRPPRKSHKVSRSVQLPEGASLPDCGRALFGWDVHRGAGLRIAATGPAEVGATVVLGQRLGLAWAVCPCRVVAAVNTDERVEFTYATLPGHPEIGAERFAFIRDGAGLRFELSAASRQAFWGSRLVPFVAERVQAIVTGRYLEAGRRLGSR